MVEAMISVFGRVVLVDTPKEEAESKVKKIMGEMRLYYDKSPPFHLSLVWESANDQSAAAWWDTYGGGLVTAQKCNDAPR